MGRWEAPRDAKVRRARDFDRLIQRIVDDINANADSYGLVPISISDVDPAIRSLGKDGYAFEYVVAREELIARRILRLDRSRLAGAMAR